MTRRFTPSRVSCSILALPLSLAFTFHALAAPFQPVFSASNFVAGAPINNPYLPFAPGTTLNQSATVTDPDTGETGFQRDIQFVTHNTANIAGVQATVVHAQSFL